MTPASRPLALDLSFEQFDALPRGATTIAYGDLFASHADLPAATRRWADERGLALRTLELKARERGSRSQKFLFALRALFVGQVEHVGEKGLQSLRREQLFLDRAEHHIV